MFEGFTEWARRVVVLAQEEARMFNHNWIGTEHILLGLIRERDGMAAQVLVKLGADLNRVRQQVIQLSSGQQPPPGRRPLREDAGVTEVQARLVQIPSPLPGHIDRILAQLFKWAQPPIHAYLRAVGMAAEHSQPDDEAYLIGPYEELLTVLRRDRPAPPAPSSPQSARPLTREAITVGEIAGCAGPVRPSAIGLPAPGAGDELLSRNGGGRGSHRKGNYPEDDVPG